MIKKLKDRSSDPELMDDVNVPVQLLHKNLHELDLLNRVTRSHAITLNALVPLIQDPDKTYKIVDLGCGSGDGLKYIADWGRKSKLDMQLIGVDQNPAAIDYMQKLCGDYPEITGVVAEATDYAAQMEPADIAISALFFHHLDNKALVDVLLQLKRKLSTGLVINDLQRHWIPYYGSWLITHLLNGTYLSKNDGPLSVRKAFRKDELHDLMAKAGISNYTLQWKLLFRYILVARMN